jgi:hypothetical protein
LIIAGSAAAVSLGCAVSAAIELRRERQAAGPDVRFVLRVPRGNRQPAEVAVTGASMAEAEDVLLRAARQLGETRALSPEDAGR